MFTFNIEWYLLDEIYHRQTYIAIDRMHKWRPKKYYFVYVLIRLTSLVGMYKIQKKCGFRARLVSLIST